MIYEDRISTRIEKKALKAMGKFFEPSAVDAGILQVLDYEYPRRKIHVILATDEFTCLCPFSGLPDFATLTVDYVPRRKLIELKSLKYYLAAFRNVKIYNEHVVNKILEDLVRALSPFEISVSAEFTSRGGITSKSYATHKAKR